MTQKLPNVATPIFISKAVSDKQEAAIGNTMRLVRVVFTLNVFIVLFLALMGKWIIVTLFKIEFVESYHLLIYLLPAVLFLGVGAIIYSYYMSNEYPPKIIIINGIFAVLSLIINYLLIIEYSTSGAAIAISITFVGWALVMLINFVIKNRLNIIEMFIIKKEDINYILSSLNRKSRDV
jgi:O-antigen/teichoic acid export membrane protein